jgi:hypothetical protein
MSWPYPGDAPIVRAKRVAWAYRQRLEEADPGACHTLDAIMRLHGQTWVVPQPVTADPQAWIGAADAAELAGISMSALASLRRSGRICGRCRTPRRWEYQVGEVQALAANPRTRSRRNEEP